jgi:predicted transcriptional regulator
MTITVKFPADLEADLRRHAEACGTPTSLVVREAVAQYLVRAQAAVAPSAAALGDDLFGRYSGPADLATGRKAALADAWGAKHAAAPGPAAGARAGRRPPRGHV